MSELSQEQINVDLFDEVKLLQKENFELKEALKPFAQYACSPKGECDCHNCKARDLL